MNTLIAILLPVVTLLAAFGLGRLAHKLWRPKTASSREQVLIDTSLGLGILSLIIFAAGLAHIFRLPYVAAIIAVPAVYGCIALASSVRAGTRARSSSEKTTSITAALFYLLMAVLLVAVLIPAAAPPAMSDWDSLAYHLAVPKLYVQHGGIYNVHIMSHANFPLLIEMLYVPAVMLNSPEAARVLNVFISVMLIAMIALTAKRHFAPKSAPLAALGVAGMPIVLFLATTAYIDLATALYTVLSVYLLMNHLDTRERSYLVGSAIAAGFASSTKMTGLVTVPLIVAWLVIDHLTATRKLAWKPALLFTAIAFAVCSPWYIKTLIYTGSPVYPFFYGVFGGRGWSSELASHYAAQQAVFGMGHDLAALLMLPWNLAFNSAAFYDRPGLFVGPLFLLAVPLFFVAKYNRKLTGLVGFFFAYVAVWFGLTHQSRYLIPGLAVLSIIVAAIVYADDRLKVTRRALGAVLTGTAIFGMLTLWPAVIQSAPVVFGRETREDYLAHSLDIYSAQEYMNKNLAASAKVALMGDTRGYYLDRDYVWADWGHSLEFSRKYSSPEDLAAYLKSRGVTHVMINFGFFPKRGKGTEPFYGAIDQGLFEEIYPVNGLESRVEVYKIN